ncbi:MAG: nuclear transport factor 2 family protein [Acidimicrobiaceae bacterium]|nr:nuclear transport factor 2 family protein [Acidimicrobiaceae bacterium]MYG99899.1 nuclear transport factor 2 family protein [Acidimicrobiaceae bacterium]MYL03717.1 nuclear transport factor 2 family protein [Acidimicrobiaceae bacterium]
MDLQTLIDRAEITDLLTRYARAVDRQDWELFRTVFTPDAHIDYTQVGGIAGDLDTVVGFLSEVMSMFEAMQHMISNIDITIDGDEAKVTAMVYNPLKLPDSGMWATGGWYHHELVRTDEGWRSRSLVEEAGWFDGVPEPAKPADQASSG